MHLPGDNKLIDLGLVVFYGIMNLGQYWLR